MGNLPKHLKNEVGKARVTGGGVYVNHGAYLFMIDSWKYVKVVSECVNVEFFVVQSREKIDSRVPAPTNKVGTTCWEIANFDGNGKQSAGKNARAVVAGLYGDAYTANMSDDDVGELLDAQLGLNQPARGMLIGCDTYPQEKRSRPGEYIVGRNWKHIAVPGTGLNAPALVQARLAAYAISPEECVRVVTEQIRSIGGSVPVSAAPPAPPVPVPAPPAPPLASVPVVPVAPPAPAPAPVDPFAGWIQHPSDPAWFYRGNELKSRSDLLAAAAR